MFFILSKEKIPSKLWPRLIKPSENQGLENPKSIKKKPRYDLKQK